MELGKKRGVRPVAPLLSTPMAGKLPAVPAVVPTSAAAIIAPRHRLGLIYGQRTALELRSVQGFDRSLSLTPGPHFDKTKPAGLARELVRDHNRGLHGPVCREYILQLSVGNRIRQTADL